MTIQKLSVQNTQNIWVFVYCIEYNKHHMEWRHVSIKNIMHSKATTIGYSVVNRRKYKELYYVGKK
jgi:hypothetical protein